MNPRQVIAGLILFVLIAMTGAPVTAAEKAAHRKIRSMVQNGSVVLAGETGETLWAINPERILIPASIIKILTAMIALDVLGEDFRFQTGFYTNAQGDLAVKGFGDPFLVSDEIRIIARQLKNRGIDRINRIVLDHSYFGEDLAIPGRSQTSNPYDALNGALVVNFNTIHVRKATSGKIESAEPETPLTPLASARAAAIPRGKAERINLSSDRADCNRYAGQLFRAIFREQGIFIVNDTIAETTVDETWQSCYVHRNSHTLIQVLRGLLQYSNNFIANQIFLVLPQLQDSATPASMQKSRRMVEGYIRTRLNIHNDALVMVEGSGISRDNRITGSIMIAILERFKPYADLLSPKNGHPAKSGTLNGVYNYAGYIKAEQGLRPFVLMLNQPKNNRDAIVALLSRL